MNTETEVVAPPKAGFFETTKRLLSGRKKLSQSVSFILIQTTPTEPAPEFLAIQGEAVVRKPPTIALTTPNSENPIDSGLSPASKLKNELMASIMKSGSARKKLKISAPVVKTPVNSPVIAQTALENTPKLTSMSAVNNEMITKAKLLVALANSTEKKNQVIELATENGTANRAPNIFQYLNDSNK